MILFLHNRYRASGGEERAVEDLLWLVREHLGEDAELLERDSALLGRGRAAAGMLRGGLAPAEVARAVRRTGARVVHAHNLNPAFGWRALAAARDAGARVDRPPAPVPPRLRGRHLLHRRVGSAHAATGATRSRGSFIYCRGSAAESFVYGGALALWQRRVTQMIDAAIVPSNFALARLRSSARRCRRRTCSPHPVRGFAAASPAPAGGYALFAGRLEPEKGLDVAIEACAAAGLPLVVAGDGSQRAALRRRAGRHASPVRSRRPSWRGCAPARRSR